MADEPKVRAFDHDYVIRTTAKHMVGAVDLSIRKTLDRVPEFAEDRVKSFEILKTLADLNCMKRDLQRSIEMTNEEEKL